MADAGYQTTPWRWFLLFYFSLTSTNQCLAWFSFSSLSQTTMQAYFGRSLDRASIDVLLNWGPIVGALFFPVQTWLLQQSNGLQRSIWLALHLMLAGTIIRTIPIIVTQVSGWTPGPLANGSFIGDEPAGDTGDLPFAQTPAAFAMYHAGQIIVAAAGPFVMGLVTRLACVWFPESERTTATAISQTANGMGTTIGFLNPHIFSPDAASVPNLFYFSLALAVVEEQVKRGRVVAPHLTTLTV